MNILNLIKLCCGVVACVGLVTTGFAATNDTPTSNGKNSGINIKIPDISVTGPKVDVKAPQVTVDKSKWSKKTITLKKGTAQFNLELPANRTTGYSWFLGRYDQKLFTPVNHEYIKLKNGAMGAGGMERWTFKVNPKAYDVPRMSMMMFIYAQPWNLKDYKKQMIVIVIQ